MFKINHQSSNSRGNNHYNAFAYSNMNWATHFHKNLELIYVMRGKLPLTVNENGLTVTEGECAMILSNQIHSFSVDNETLAWVVVFSEDFVPEFASFIKDKQGKNIAFRPDDEIAALITENLILGKASLLMKKSCLYALCDQYLKKTELEERKGKNDDLICHILDYIEAHYSEDITLEKVAQEFGYEYHYLSRLLNRNYNIRFKHVVNEYRVDQAIKLLEKGEMSMTEISIQCGFQSIRSFNEVFRIVTGRAPSDYSKKVLSRE